MKAEVKGYLYKRKMLGKKAIHLDLDDPVPATIYVQYTINKRRKIKSLDTKDPETARQRWADMKADFASVSNEARYLQRLIASKENDIRRLQQLQMGGSDVVLVKDAFERFLHSKKRRKETKAKTLSGYRQQFDRFVKWSPGTIRTLRDLTPALCERYIDDLESMDKDTGKPIMNADTVDKHISFLKLLWGIVDPSWPNPWVGLHSGKEHEVRHFRRLSVTECRTLYEKAPGEFRALFLLGFSTGQRLIDLATLKWEQVDQRKRTITITPTKTDRRTAKTVVIPMTDQLRAELGTGRSAGYVLPDIAQRYTTSAANVSKAIVKIMDDNDVASNKHGKASFHSFRHTFASLLDEKGCPLQIRAYLTTHAFAGQLGSIGASGVLPGVTGIYSHPDIKPIREWLLRAIPKL